MNSTLKVFGLLIVFFTLTFLGLLIGFNTHAQTIVELSDDEQATVEFIKTLDERLIWSEEKSVNILNDKREKIGSQDVVDYSYLGNEVSIDETIFDDGNYSSVKKLNDHLFAIYGESIYYKNPNGQVQEIITERTTQTIWNTTQIQSNTDKLQALFKTPYCLADTIYSGTGDGYVGLTANIASWETTRNASTGSTSGYSGDELYAVNYRLDGTNRCDISRMFFPFDTSSLPDGDLVASSTFFVKGSTVYDEDNDEYGYEVLVAGTPNETDKVVNSDYNKTGDTKFSNTVDLTGFSTSNYNAFLLNGAATSTFDMEGYTTFALREGHDIDNVAVGTGLNEGAVIWSVEKGTTYRPYLLVETYTPETETPTATTTSDLYPCSIPTNSRIDWITGCKNIYGSSTATSTITAIEYYYYQIPIAVWIVFGTCFIYLFSRLRLEYLMRFRK